MNMNTLNDDIDYWTARLETERAALKEMTERTRRVTDEMEDQRLLVAAIDKVMMRKMRLRVKILRRRVQRCTPLRRSARIASRTASARIAQDAGLRRSPRIAARR